MNKQVNQLASAATHQLCEKNQDTFLIIFLYFKSLKMLILVSI